jgi:hypothetical protein
MRRNLIPAVLVLGLAAGAWLYVRAGGPGSVRVLADLPRMSAGEALAQRERGYRDIDSIEELLALPGHFARMEALYALAGRSDSAAVQVLIFQASGIADASDRRDTLLVLFARLAELDPLSALALAGTPAFAAEPLYEREIWRAWGGLDLDAALAHAATLPPIQRARAAQALFAAYDYWGSEETARIAERLGAAPDTRSRSAHLQDLASADPAAAIAYVKDLESALQRRHAAAQLGRLLAGNGLEAAERWAGAFQDAALRRAFEDAAAQAAAEVDPDGTLRRLLAADASAESRARLAGAFAAVAAQDIYQALGWFEQVEDPGQRSVIGRTLAEQLALADPEAALAWARDNDRGLEHELSQAVLTTIADFDPERAFAYAQDLEAREWNGLLFVVAQRVAQRDPALAARLTEGVANRRNRTMIMPVIAHHWVQSDPRAALDWILSAKLEDREQYVAAAAMTLARTDPDAALALLPQLDENVARAFRVQIASALVSERSLAEAQAFIARFEGTPEYPRLVAGVIQGLARSEPRAAVEMLERLPREEQDALSLPVFMRYAMQAPREAAEAAVAVSERGGNRHLLQFVMQHWVQADPQAAEQWAEQMPPGHARDVAIQGLASHWSDLTPARRRLLEGIEGPEDRYNAISTLVFRMARTDPVRAEQVLQSFELPDERREFLLERLDDVAREASGYIAYW